MTEVIRNQKAVQSLFIDLVKAAELEILLIFPTANSFFSRTSSGNNIIIKVLCERGIYIKILTPVNREVHKIIQAIEEETRKQSNQNLHIRLVDVTYQETTVNTVTIIIVDKKASLAIEKLDDSKKKRFYGIKPNCTKS